jgi:hypothetical protein
MRKFTVRRGNYKGEHNIYDSPDEAVKHSIEPKHPWHRKDVQIGDWVVSDDGYVVQCLNRRILINKRHRSGQYTDTFRFPMGIFGVYYDAKGEKKITKNFYAQVANNNKSSLGNTSVLGKYMTIEKREFVTLMAMGFDPYSAYIKAYKVKRLVTLPNVTMQINKLLTDKQVQEELMEALKPFMHKVQLKVQELSGYEDLEKLFIDKTAQLLTTTVSSIKDQTLVLRFSFEFFGRILGIVEETNTKRDKYIQDARYTEVPPPELGLSSV